MALATQCPHCYTSFRVANDQLKLYAGLVRCGTCQQTFNGIDHILAPGETPKAKPVSVEQATITTAAAETTSKQVTTSSNIVSNPDGVSSIKSTSALPTERLVDAVANTVVDTVAEAEIAEDQLQNQIKNELPDLPQDTVDANPSEQETRKLNPLYSKNFDAVIGYKGKPIVEAVSQAKNYADGIVNGDVDEVEEVEEVKSHIDEVVNNHVDDTVDSLAHAQEENNKEEKLKTENVEAAIASDEVADKIADEVAAIEVEQLKEILEIDETETADKFIRIVEKDEIANANKVIAESAQLFHSILSDDNQSTSSSSDESPLASEAINDDIEADKVDVEAEAQVQAEVEEKNAPSSPQQDKEEINTLASLSLLTSLTTADTTLEDDIKVELKDTLNDKLNDQVAPTSEEQTVDTDESLLSKDAEHIEVSEMNLDDAAWESVVAEYTAEQKSAEHTSMPSAIEEKAKTEIDNAEAGKASLSQAKLSDIDFEVDEDHQSAQEHADQNHPTVTSETLETTEELTEEEIEAANAIEKAKAKSKAKADARAKAKAKAKVDRLIKEEVEVEVNHNENDDIDDALDALDDIDEDAESEYDANNNENDDDDHHLKPQFVIQAEKKQRYGKWITVFYSSFILLFLMTAIGQISYHYKNQIYAHFPSTQPLLFKACKLFNCQIRLLAEKGAVTKESQELVLVSSNPQILTLSVQLQNKSNTAQAWPMIELTLMDNRKKTLLQRVFTPQEYLENKKEVGTGIGAISEKNIDINFELSIPKAASYEVKLFYP